MKRPWKGEFIMKKFKRIAGLFLAFTFALQTVVVFADNDLDSGYFVDFICDSIVHHQVFDDVGIVEEVFEYQGNLLHLIRTDDFIFASEMTSLGYYNFAFRYIDGNTIIVGDMMLPDLLEVAAPNVAQSFGLDSDTSRRNLVELNPANLSRSVREGDMLSNVQAISFAAVENINEFSTEIIAIDITIYHDEPVEFVNEESSVSFAPMSTGPINPARPSMAAVLANDFGPHRIGQLIATSNHWRGNLLAPVRLTESYTLSHRQEFSAIANIGMGIAAVSLLLGGVSFATLRGVATFVVGAGGALFTFATTIFTLHRAEEHWTRIATVHGSTFYWSGRTRAWNVAQGPQGFSLDTSRIVSDSMHWDFNDITGLMRTGANNYFWQVHNIW
jgi:hypothetical protein